MIMRMLQAYYGISRSQQAKAMVRIQCPPVCINGTGSPDRVAMLFHFAKRDASESG